MITYTVKRIIKSDRAGEKIITIAHFFTIKNLHTIRVGSAYRTVKLS